MTPDPLTLAPNATVADAYALMKERGFRHVPVADGELLLGVFSLTDVGHLGARVPQIMALPLHEVMSKNAITVKPSESISAAAVTMASKKINCLIVVDDNRIAGIVTTYDLLDALVHRIRDSSV